RVSSCSAATACRPTAAWACPCRPSASSFPWGRAFDPSPWRFPHASVQGIAMLIRHAAAGKRGVDVVRRERRGGPRQVLGAASAAFSFSSMHLLTMSARFSRSPLALPFSVFIQHSLAARERVIGGSGGLAAWAEGPGPVVSQPASRTPAAAASANARSRANRVGEGTVDCLIGPEVQGKNRPRRFAPDAWPLLPAFGGTAQRVPALSQSRAEPRTAGCAAALPCRTG